MNEMKMDCARSRWIVQLFETPLRPRCSCRRATTFVPSAQAIIRRLMAMAMGVGMGVAVGTGVPRTLPSADSATPWSRSTLSSASSRSWPYLPRYNRDAGEMQGGRQHELAHPRLHLPSAAEIQPRCR